MKTYSDTTFDISLFQSDHHPQSVHYFLHDAEDDVEIGLPITEPLYAVVINLSPNSDTYVHHHREAQIPAGYFNILSVSKDSTRWRFKEGINSLVVITFNPNVRNMFREAHAAIDSFFSAEHQEKAVNPMAHVLTPAMDTALAVILSDIEDHGMLTVMHRQAKAIDLLFSALEISELHHDNKIDDDAISRIKDVYEYMTEHLEDVLTPGDLINLSGMTETQIEQHFDTLYNLSLAEAIDRARLIRAEDLVRFSNEHVFEIAGMSGFPSFQEFLDSFENRFGMHPMKFRELYGPH